MDGVVWGKLALSLPVLYLSQPPAKMTGELDGLGRCGMVTPFGRDWERVSNITTQICFTHSMMDCGMPAIVMGCSVELGSISPATWT